MFSGIDNILLISIIKFHINNFNIRKQFMMLQPHKFILNICFSLYEIILLKLII